MAKTIKDIALDTPDVNARIHKVIGQCQGVERMLKEGKSCESILLQVNAAKSALHRVGQLLLERHIATQISECARTRAAAEETAEKTATAIDYFCRMK